MNYDREKFLNFKVTDKESFVEFLNLLSEDLFEVSEKWQNIRLDHFLEAMASYTEDIQGYYDNTNKNIDSKNATWELFADILRGAAIYE